MVDPLDGTKEFINRNGEFTVNIALIQHNIPVLGVIYIPEQKLIYFAAEGSGSFKYQITENKLPIAHDIIANAQNIKTQHNKNEIRVAVSRSHIDKETLAFIDKIRTITTDNLVVVKSGSSLKFCLIAEGKADIYLRFSPTMEWDTAAGHVIAIQAGAIIKNQVTKPFYYNKSSLKNDGFFISNPESITFADFY
jgi:3'(2'), 5'-bisphosphate nucleotidase